MNVPLFDFEPAQLPAEKKTGIYLFIYLFIFFFLGGGIPTNVLSGL